MNRIIIGVALTSALAAGSAFAADLPYPAAPPAPPAPAYVPATFSWAGIYVGVNGGYAFGTSDWIDTPTGALTSGDFSTKGFLAGGTVGGNFQVSALVFGFEGDVDWTDLKGTSAATSPCPSCVTASNWFGTARGRIGFALDRVLLFATGGAAFGNLEMTPLNIGSTSETEFGWTAGGGVEVALSQNWSAKVEYLYVDFVKPSFALGANNISVSFTENVVRAGVNLRFSP